MGNKVIGFADLDVYKRLYGLALTVHKKLLPKLPESERFVLKDQLSRSSKSPPALIAEGYARRQSSNESIVHISLARDMYPTLLDSNVCNNLIEEYNISGKQLFRLGESWQ